MKKDVIYVDIDDEITSITDKISKAKAPVIALVLPKRCPVLQSSVNIKILKRTTENIGKNLVLITSEASILPLAGTAGIYVAKTLQSKPAIPIAPDAEEVVDTIKEVEEPAEPKIDHNKSIGELAGKTAVAATADEDEVPIELGEEPDEKTEADPKDGKPKNKKLRVPSFDKFRNRLLIIAGVVILLIGLWVLAEVVLPKASVTVTAQSKTVPVSFNVVGSPTATAVDSSKNIVPAQVKTDQKSETKQFQATGQQNNGNKATGTVRLTDCSPNGKAITVPAGSTVSSSGLSFITQTDVTLDFSTVPLGSGSCKDTSLPGVGNTSEDVKVVAAGGGSQYNLSGSRSYTVSVANVTGYASNGMGGGTDNIVTIVAQADCDGAKNDLLNTKTDDFKNQLNTEITANGLVPIKDTFSLTPGTVSCNPAVGQPATSSTATVQFTFKMMGVNSTGLDQLVKAEATKQIQGSQSVINTGVSSAVINMTEQKSNGDVAFSLVSNAQTGIKQDPSIIAKSILGKKYGDSVNIIQNMPGVSAVKITYSPFWVSTTPKAAKHITVKFVNDGK
ncbi:MAG TPA: hypothetical protein VMR51_01260 [Patescibacteria group bacterium]|nr:hypothetical protein [Patescibacteria group bacterium]